MRNADYKIFSLGENAVTIELANEISEQLNDRVLSIESYFRANAFPGMIEIVSAYSSLTIFFDVYQVKRSFPGSESAFGVVRELASNAVQNTSDKEYDDFRTIEIPVCFNDEYGLDLRTIAESRGLAPEGVIEIFSGRTYRVYMLGFLPGFAYMGEVDERIATPRKSKPRVRVPKGSVGIAGTQTGIYPFDLPGGWQIIGRSSIDLFTPENDTPSYFRVGDRVKFLKVEKL